MRKGIAATAILAALLAFVPWQPVMALRLPPLLIDSPLAKKLGFIGGGRALGLGVTITASSCTDTIVNTAIVSAMPGDTVVVPPGTCTWSTKDAIGFYYQSNITLQGSGSGAGGTIIDATPLNGVYAFLWRDINGVGGGRITGFHWICGMIQVAGPGWRIDHNSFTCSTSFGTAVYAAMANMAGYTGGTSPLNGLVDNNTMLNQRVLVDRWASGDLTEQNGSTLWSEPLGLGGSNSVYIEDNTFTFTTFGNVVDCQESGHYVFRHNVVHEAYPEAHTARGYFRGCRKIEIYENVFTQSAITVSSVAIINGGTGVIYNNEWIGTFGANTGTLALQRAYVDDGPNSFGLCNGASPWDGNQDATGWPCVDQLGRSTDPTPFVGAPPPYPTHSQSSDPAYFWNNKIHVLMTDPKTDLVWSAFNAETGARVMAGRDYFTSSNTPKPGYTSYTYPHPLQGVGPGLPRPATGVIVTPGGH